MTKVSVAVSNMITRAIKASKQLLDLHHFSSLHLKHTPTAFKMMKRPTSEPYYDLGIYAWKISTQNPEAQEWFNRGLNWTYAFNHEEACYCFRQAIAHDTECAMAHWGLAFAAGPNHNKSWAVFSTEDLKKVVTQCNSDAQVALEKSSMATPMEKAVIQALQKRYSIEEVTTNFPKSNKAYAEAMREVYREFGHDNLDITTLFADALMTWTPRDFFDKKTGNPVPSSSVLEVKGVLETGLKHAEVSRHPGVPHMYIHLMEMSDTPEKALPAADIIRNLVPDAGHMSHMPCHIDVLVGEVSTYGQTQARNFADYLPVPSRYTV
ncbi:unnamed protein product [Alternaria alternata]